MVEKGQENVLNAQLKKNDYIRQMKTVNTINMYRKASRIDLFDAKRIVGVLRIGYEKNGEYKMISMPTLEHRDYIFAEGIYKLKYEYSGKYKRKLWEFKDIHGRTEIKFHVGTSTKHTKGCVLLARMGITILHSVLDSSKEYYINIQNN